MAARNGGNFFFVTNSNVRKLYGDRKNHRKFAEVVSKH